MPSYKILNFTKTHGVWGLTILYLFLKYLTTVSKFFSDVAALQFEVRRFLYYFLVFLHFIYGSLKCNQVNGEGVTMKVSLKIVSSHKWNVFNISFKFTIPNFPLALYTSSTQMHSHIPFNKEHISQVSDWGFTVVANKKKYIWNHTYICLDNYILY